MRTVGILIKLKLIKKRHSIQQSLFNLKLMLILKFF